jgi:DNA gyrase subunit A
VFDAGDNTEPTSVSAGAFPQIARDAKPGKIRGHSSVIDRIIG